MATRIHPQPAPAEPASPHLEPNAEMLLAAPPKLSKRLTAAVHRSLPGWTVQVLVKRWAEDAVHVVVTGQRDAGAIAPPAPPTGSAEAEKLSRRVAAALERSVEQDRPGTDWSIDVDYSSSDLDHFKCRLAGKKNDPPTCIDGEGEVIFPGVDFLVPQTGEITVPASPPSGSVSLPPRYVYLHYHGAQTPPPLPDPQLLGYSALATNSIPQLFYAGSPVVLQAGLTFGQLVTSTAPLVLQVSSLDDWWVWW